MGTYIGATIVLAVVTCIAMSVVTGLIYKAAIRSGKRTEKAITPRRDELSQQKSNAP